MDARPALTSARRLPGARVVERLKRRFSTSPWGAAAEMAARLGYMARGTVYLSIGLIALLAVAGVAPHTRGAIGALEAWARWRAGVVLLWLTGFGLWGFAGWRMLQSLFDADRQGRSLQAIGSRVGQALSGLIYGAMAASIFDLIDALHDIRHQGEQAKTRETVAAVMTWPMGSTLVIALGVFITACGLGNAIRAFVDNFGSTLRCDPKVVTWACRLARVGYLGRGLAMLPVGFFMLAAGWHARASEARGVGGALWALHSQVLGNL
ncbi:MAG: DUF1206 domain-containing protein, partial [Caulobacterales bacterium]